jgi:hypothetical protein
MIPKSIYFILVIAALTFGVCPANAGAGNEIPFNTSVPGERNLGDLYTFTVYNCSGLADASYQVNVNTWTILPNYSYYSVSWGQWFKQEPAKDKKFLFVWVRIDELGTSWWGWGQDRFNAWLWDNWTLGAEPVQVIDMTGVYKNGIHVTSIEPRVIYEIRNVTGPDGFPVSDDPFGYRDGLEQGRITPGDPFDGYIIYQVPASIRVEDIRIAGWFRNFGTAYWNLVNRSFDQDSVEAYRYRDLERINLEKEMQFRIADTFERDSG